MRRAKIVATLGPALDDRAKLRAALEAGIDVARLNFSHGEAQTHARRAELIRSLSAELGRNVAVLADMQGPKMRLGILPDDGVELESGGQVYLRPGHETLDEYVHDGVPTLPVVYEPLGRDVEAGSLILIADGSIRLVVSEVSGLDDGPGIVRARCVVGGVATSRKGVNLPGVAVSAPCLTDKDLEDLKTAVDLGADWVAMSFVRTVEDIATGHERITAYGGEAPICAKLERPESIENLDEILAATDAVMVARGDLGVEIGPERVPAIQKEIINRANEWGRPVITATEMLESMVSSPRATRAEASDVANAVFDGSDALMLSAESAAGRYPVEAVRTMARIIEVAESSANLVHPQPPRSLDDVGGVVAQAAVQVANDVKAAAIVVFSISGLSIQRVGKYRPVMPLIGLTPREMARRRTALMWGTDGMLVPMEGQTTALTEAAERALLTDERFTKGDVIVIVSGVPGGIGGTNRILVHRLGDAVHA